MARKLLLAAALIIVAAGAAAALVAYKNRQPDPIEKRGSAREEFDRSAAPKTKPPPKKSSLQWPMFGYDLQRTKAAPFDHRPPYDRTWRFDAGDTLEFPPSAAYGNVYVAQQKGLFFALKGKSGKRLFTKRFRRCAASSPTIGNHTVYQAYMDFVPCPQGASNPSGFVIAMDAESGRRKWRFNVKPVESSPLLRRGILYFGSWDGNVYAIRAKDGRKVWSHGTGDRVNTSAAYSKGRVFIANDSGTVYALSARTGRRIWSASQAEEFFYATPVVAYGRVFVGSTDGTMYAFGQRSGKLLWAKDLGTYVYSSAAVYRQRVYAGSYDGKFYALDAATGDVRWMREMPSAVHAAPVVMAGLVYVSTCGTCGSAASRRVKMGKDSTTAFDALTGKVVWFNQGGKYASPVIADRDRVYYSGRSYLYALQPAKKATTPRARRRKLRNRRGSIRRSKQRFEDVLRRFG